jgi:hypothetical protein
LTLQGKRWHEQRLRARDYPPHAFVEWEDSALLVDSPIGGCGWATSSPIEQLDRPRGTVFTQVAPNGVLSHPTLGLDSTFMAWDASSAANTLSLVGTYGVRADGGAPEFGTHDIVVMRRQGQGTFAASTIVKVNGIPSQSVRTRIRESGPAAVLWPPPARDDGTRVAGVATEAGDEIAWKDRASLVFKISQQGIASLRFRSVHEQDCYAREAAVVGDEVYVIVACPDELTKLVQAVAQGEPQSVDSFTLSGVSVCAPVQVMGLAADDLWVRARCGPAGQPKIDAIFRRGAHPRSSLKDSQ